MSKNIINNNNNIPATFFVENFVYPKEYKLPAEKVKPFFVFDMAHPDAKRMVRKLFNGTQGIYAWIQKDTNVLYVGSQDNIASRGLEHYTLKPPKACSEINPILKKEGIKGFYFVVIEILGDTLKSDQGKLEYLENDYFYHIPAQFFFNKQLISYRAKAHEQTEEGYMLRRILSERPTTTKQEKKMGC